ncbi:MAG: caspase family protein [Burkholderiaceae bacterium]
MFKSSSQVSRRERPRAPWPGSWWLFCAMLAALLAGPAQAQVRGAAAPGKAVLQIELGGHSAPVRRLAVSAARGLIVTAGDDKTARVWDLNSHELRQVLRPPVGDGETGRLYGAAFHPDGSRVAVAGSTGTTTGGHRILVFAPDTGQLIKQFDALGGDVKNLRYTPDGRLLLAVYAGENHLRAFDAEGREVFGQALPGLAYGLDVTSDGRIAVATLAGTVHLFRQQGDTLVADGELRGEGHPVSVAFSPDGTRLAVGYFDPANRTPPQVFDLASRRAILRLEPARLEAGNLMTVGFSGDGTMLLAGGTGYRQAGEHALHVFDARNGAALGEHLLATNSIFDLAAVAPRSTAFVAFDGSWGVIDLQPGKVRSTGAGLADLRGPRNLRINADATQIGFSFDLGRHFSVFDLKRREIRPGPLPDGLNEPRTKRGFFGGATWENERKPSINGQSIPLASDEVGRSIAYLNNSDEALFGSSKALMAITADGGVRWRTATNAEVLAINVRADDKLALTAMSDGTIRWWDIQQGRLVLSLLPRPDGRWVLFGPDGSYDASAGADRIVGWSVNRDDGALADYFSLNRFRDRFHRPTAIDSLLGLSIAPASAPVAALPAPAQSSGAAPAATGPGQAGGTGIAVEKPGQPAAPVAGGATAAPAAAPLPGPAPARPAAVDLQRVTFPPVLGAVDLKGLKRRNDSVQIPFTIRAKGKPQVEVRIDGRPSVDARIVLPPSFTGRERAIAELRAPAEGSVIQIIARDENGTSEPLGFKMPAPVPPAAPEAGTAPASAAGSATPAGSAAAAPAAVIAVPAVIDPVTASPLQLAQTLALAAPSVAAAQVPPPPPAPPTPPAANKRGPRLFVLAIGISQYKRPDYQLGLADKDSRDFVRAVTAQQGRYYAQVNAKVLTNEKATRAQVIAGLDWLAKEVGPDDVGMLFMAGHGVNAPDGQYYFIPYEGQHEQLAATGVPEQTIRSTLGRMRGKALFFVDTCYAGNALGNFQTASRELAKLANNLAASENGVIVFASSSGRQLSEENDAWGNGAFTKALIEGLSGKADLTRSGRITYKGLDYYVSDQVSRLTEGRQTPVTISPVGVPDFAIASVRQI